MEKKRGQVWVETVIYTLIAFAMIGLVLSFVKPKMEEIRDQITITKTIEMMENLDDVILAISSVAGNQRLVELGINKGELKIKSSEDELIFEMESLYVYSQPGEDVTFGDIVVNTKSLGKTNIVTLKKSYGEYYNFTYQDEEKEKILGKSSTSYKLSLSNKGKINDKTVINFEVI